MAKVTLHVEMPKGFDAALWPMLAEKLLQLLATRYDLVTTTDEACSWQLWDFLNTQQIKDIAVFIFGNDLPATVDMTARLRLRGDGDCPSCGSNNREEIFGGYVRPEYGSAGGERVLGWRCQNCKHEDYR
jgi:hypothetical protein